MARSLSLLAAASPSVVGLTETTSTGGGGDDGEQLAFLERKSSLGPEDILIVGHEASNGVWVHGESARPVVAMVFRDELTRGLGQF